MVFVFFLTIVGVPVLFVLFSAPKSKLKKITPRIITGLSTGNVVDETEVFSVIKNAGIEPCFLNLEDDEENNIYPKIKNVENFDKPIELQSFEVKKIESPIRVRVRKKLKVNT